MAREKFENGSLNSNGFIGILGIGSIICMFCVVVLGLKLKWFRAQIKFGDSHINKKSEQSVQGLKFKIKPNPDDFQSYKLISEFSSITAPQYATNQTFGIKSSRPNQLTKSESIPNINTESSSSIKKSSNLMSKSKSSANLTQEPKEINPKPKKSPKNKSATKIIEPLSGTNPPKLRETKSPKIQERKANKTEKEISLNLDEATNSTLQIRNPLGTDRRSTKFDEDNWDINYVALSGTNPPKLRETKSPKIQERKINNAEKEISLNLDKATNSTLQIRNPLGTDRRSTKFDEDNWDITYDVENGKESKMVDLETESSMYSSQAASIFFGGAQPRVPTRNLITYDSDPESVGSQTSA